VFVLPSLFGEGMPMVILEAMAAGLPVVSTRVEGIPQVVRDGEDGLLTESANAQGLADALSLFASGTVSAEAMGNSGWQRQRESFSDSVMAARVARIYREVLTP
jgi:glycosyltransferase involved in cell wall biosynthesis